MLKLITVLALALASPVSAFPQASAAPAAVSSDQSAGVLSPALTEKLLPPSVLYKGQQAPVQARNSGAVRYGDGTLVIASLVDSSGYSTGIREKYQFFLYTERTLTFAGKSLVPGFYGGGFLANNTFVLTDVSGRDLITAPTSPDTGLKRPRPLQIVLEPGTREPRLYLGRSFVALPAVN